MNLSTLSVAELRNLQQAVAAELKQREVQERENLRKELLQLAQARGFSLDELFSNEGKGKAASGKKVRVKYRHPSDASLTWTGRGRKPKWVEGWLAAGGNLEGLLAA
ncbi:MAG: H-NS family nucleoid-associated regulatory protein [Azonexus sp.]|jgi:DNA-binding protein H-NS